MNRKISLYTLAGVTEARITTYYVETEDKLKISMMRFWKAECDDVVLIIHGLTTSSDMFIMPEHENLVTWLHKEGYSDVFTLDFRMSNRHNYNLFIHRFSVDDCALFDHPAAVAKLREVVGCNKRIHVICHCLGSMSFVMSLFAKQLEVTSVIANSVALSPHVPTWSYIKSVFSPFLIEKVFGRPYVKPNGFADAQLTFDKVLSWLVSCFHKECDVPACHMLSLMWGTGWPALYEHRNLAQVTHERGGDLYGATSLNYHRHVLKMLRANNTAVRMYPDKPEHATLPLNYFFHAKEIDTPVLFMTGKSNRVFADSNIQCLKRLEEMDARNNHDLLIVDGYGHQDPFMGKNAAKDVFPQFKPFLDKHAERG